MCTRPLARLWGWRLWGRMQEDRAGIVTWFGVALGRASTSGERGAGARMLVEGRGPRKQARCPAFRQGCRAAIVASCRGRAAACAAMCVCALCAYAMHLADTYPHVHCAGVRQCLPRVVCVASGHWHHSSQGRQPGICCCVAVGAGGTLISSCHSSCGGACGHERACGGGLHCSWVQIRSREPR